MPEKVGGLAMPGFNEEMNVKHNPDDLARAFKEMNRIFEGHNAKDAVVVEEEMFQLFLHDRQGVEIIKTLKVNLLDYKPDERKHTFILLIEKEGKRIFLISKFTHYQTFVPFQAKMLSQRLVLSVGVKRIITCPNIWSLENAKIGQLYVPLDHINCNTKPPGIGVNVAICGPRFYDIATMYNSALREKAMELFADEGIHSGYLLWVNGNTIPGEGIKLYAKGVETPDIKFNAATNEGIEQLFALHHWKSEKESSHEYSSLLIGVIHNTTIRSQDISNPDYRRGVYSLLKKIWSLL